MKKNSIKCEFHGIINPILIIKIDKNINPKKLDVYENQEKLKFYIEEYKKVNRIIVNLQKKQSKITIYNKDSGDKIIVNNNFIKRIFSKIFVNIFYSKRKLDELMDIQENYTNINVININKKNKGMYDFIFETKEEKFNINLTENNKDIDFNIEKLGYNIYSCTFKKNDRAKSIKFNIKAENKKTTTFLLFEDKSNLKNEKYYHLPIVGIQFYSLTGILKPSFYVQGTGIHEDIDYKIMADNKMLEYTRIPLDDLNSFAIKTNIPFNTKNIKFMINIKEHDIKILEVRNYLIKRLYKKIIINIKQFFIKIKIITINLIKGIKFLWKEHHFIVPIVLWKKYITLFFSRLKDPLLNYYNPFIIEDYNNWLKENAEQSEIKKFKYNPLISILIPIYNVDSKYLEECINSILDQTYENFEICLVDDCSTKKETKNTLRKYENHSKIKIKYRGINGHISAATNDALKMSEGEFIGLVDNDDVLDKNALYECVKALNENNKTDFIYTDEDKININGEFCDPNFKPDYSPETLLSLNYICHFSLIRKKLIDKVGGFELGLEGAQDHDLFLKISELTDNIYHIPKVLYHWRMLETSTAMNLSNKDYINNVGVKVVENAIKRRGLKGNVVFDSLSKYYITNYIPSNNHLISIIIPTRDYAETLKKCVDSIYNKTTYKNYEVIVVNNNSEEKSTYDLFEQYKKQYNNFKVIDANIEFNYSKINNIAVKVSKGDYIVLLNNDTEIISENWLEVMLGYAELPHVGAVGPKLLYPDTTVQHAGVVLGLGGVASHIYLYKDRNDSGMYGRLRVPYNYSAVTAACLMVEKRKYNEVKGLEEELKVAYNDVDFNIKLLKKGYYNVCTPQIELFHYESKSRGLDTSSEKYKRFLKESKYMYDKWGDTINNDSFYNKNFSKKHWFLLDKNK